MNRRMNYGSIQLVPVAADTHRPWHTEEYKDMWHIPGRTIMSTDALVTLATRKGIAVSIVEQEGINHQTTRLN